MHGCDAVVFAPTMAAPPSYAARALADVEAPLGDLERAIGPSGCRTISTRMRRRSTRRASARSCTATSSSARDVGPRSSRPVTTTRRPIDRLLRIVRAVAAGGSVRGSTVLRLGDPIPGLPRRGIEALPSSPGCGVTEHAIARTDSEARVGAHHRRRRGRPPWRAPLRSEGGLVRRRRPGRRFGSAAVAVALERAMVEAGAVAGTVRTATGPWFPDERGSQDPGLSRRCSARLPPGQARQLRRRPADRPRACSSRREWPARRAVLQSATRPSSATGLSS